MNTSLNKQVHALLNNTGLAEQKANLVLGFTQGRSESSRDMTDGEAVEFINYLRRQASTQAQPHPDPLQKEREKANKMRRKIISMAHEMHWHLSGTQKIDMPRLNGWCEKFGYGHKKLNDYSYNELPALVSQFTKVYKDYLHKF